MIHAIVLLAAAMAGVVDHQASVHIDHREVAMRSIIEGDARSCTVVIDGQPVATYGHGDLEAYRCGGLLAAGRLRRHHGVERIGLVYQVGGSPGIDFRTALVIERVAGQWRIDAMSAGLHDDMPEARSIQALRRWEDLPRDMRQTKSD